MFAIFFVKHFAKRKFKLWLIMTAQLSMLGLNMLTELNLRLNFLKVLTCPALMVPDNGTKSGSGVTYWIFP